MMKKIIISAILIYISFTIWAVDPETIIWEKTVIDENDSIIGGIAIGNPYIGFTPSNKKNLYCSCINRNLVEYSFENNQWNKSIVLSDIGFEGISIDYGRNDNNERIYCIENEKLYEVWCYMGIWFSNLIFEITDSQFDYLVIGDGSNDGVNRVYVSSKEHIIYELTFVGPGHNDWDIEIIDQEMYCEDIGQGRNDNNNRIYGIGGDDEWTIYELSYNAVSEIWEREEVYTYIWMTDFTYSKPCWGVSLGKTRRDNELYRIYYLDVAGKINELFWNGSSWDNYLINVFSSVNEEGYGFGLQEWGKPFTFGEIDTHEPSTKLFFINGKNSIYSFIFNSEIWNRNLIEETDLMIDFLDLVFGDVRSIGDPALYILSLENSIIEFYPDSD